MSKHFILIKFINKGQQSIAQKKIVDENNIVTLIFPQLSSIFFFGDTLLDSCHLRDWDYGENLQSEMHLNKQSFFFIYLRNS